MRAWRKNTVISTCGGIMRLLHDSVSASIILYVDYILYVDHILYTSTGGLCLIQPYVDRGAVVCVTRLRVRGVRACLVTQTTALWSTYSCMRHSPPVDV